MKKIIVMASLLIIALGAVIYFSLISNDKPKIEHVEDNSIETAADENRFLELKEKRTTPIEEEWPIGETSEASVQHAIHGMSHQKVKAEEKWHFEALTMEKVLHLQKVVEASNFEHKQTYANILERWANNDFSQVVQDHNAIWELQGGTVGEAYEAYTYEEELEFIESHYK